jgi:hypothetical protein
MALGKRDGIRPADVVGSIANEAGIAGSEIGPIDIRDEITYVSIPARYRDDVLAKLGGARFRGRPVNLRVAAPERPPRERPRFDRESRPPAGRFQRDARTERPRADKPFRPGATAAPRGSKPFPPKRKPKR